MRQMSYGRGAYGWTLGDPLEPKKEPEVNEWGEVSP